MRGIYHASISLVTGFTIFFPFLYFGVFHWAPVMLSLFFIMS
ncbi:MAG: hypothetical protein ACXAC7_18260 [Candidatus Hodarchaeales archaeon]|jgi:hypothetical protein